MWPVITTHHDIVKSHYKEIKTQKTWLHFVSQSTTLLDAISLHKKNSISSVIYWTVLYSTALYSTLLYSTVLRSTVLCCAVLYRLTFAIVERATLESQAVRRGNHHATRHSCNIEWHESRKFSNWANSWKLSCIKVYQKVWRSSMCCDVL